MNAFIKSMMTAALFTAISCGSFQTKSAGSEDINDDFFKDESSPKTLKGAASNAAPQKAAEAKVSSGPAATKTGDSDLSSSGESEVRTDVETGYAAWYGRDLQGRPTASGEIFDMNKYTGAHRDYPMGSIVLVRNLENGKKKLVRVNDRGPYVDGRIIDVSYAAARDLGFAEKGVARVEVELIEKGSDSIMARKADVKKETAETAPEAPEDGVEKLDAGDMEDYFFADGLRPKNFTVRVGAFKVLKNAEKYREDLEDKYNLNAFMGKKGKFHFVWIGDFDDKETAKNFYQKLKTDGLDVLNPKKVQ